MDSRKSSRDLLKLKVPKVGSVAEGIDGLVPYQIVDRLGQPCEPVTDFLKDLLASGRARLTLRSYAMDLLRWFRFLWAVQIDWDRATRIDARDFTLWLQCSDKPIQGRRPASAPVPGTVNAVTGKPVPGIKYQETTQAHSETVLRSFYDFHLSMGTGPVLNPFPLRRSPGGARPLAHHNPMSSWPAQRSGLYRPKLAKRIPRCIPDELFNELFASLPDNRDRALVAFYVSAGVRASELLGACVSDVDVGQQLIAVVRKGSRAVQWIPASPDAFVWLALYQRDVRGVVPLTRKAPLWWTLRAPARPLTYHAAHRRFTRINAMLGTNWTLHDLRHSAAYRMARDPQMPLTDVQWVLGHAHLSYTQRYLNPRELRLMGLTLRSSERGALLPQRIPVAA